MAVPGQAALVAGAPSPMTMWSTEHTHYFPPPEYARNAWEVQHLEGDDTVMQRRYSTDAVPMHSQPYPHTPNATGGGFNSLMALAAVASAEREAEGVKYEPGANQKIITPPMRSDNSGDVRMEDAPSVGRKARCRRHSVDSTASQGGGRRLSVDDGPVAELRYQRRREKNREAAQLCRQKKKEQLTQLREAVEELQRDNQALGIKIETLTQDKADLQAMAHDLMCANKELEGEVGRLRGLVRVTYVQQEGHQMNGPGTMGLIYPAHVAPQPHPGQPSQGGVRYDMPPPPSRHGLVRHHSTPAGPPPPMADEHAYRFVASSPPAYPTPQPSEGGFFVMHPRSQSTPSVALASNPTGQYHQPSSQIGYVGGGSMHMAHEAARAGGGHVMLVSQGTGAMP